MIRSSSRPAQLLVWLAALVIALAVSLMPASAGSNGQQIRLHKEVSSINYSWVFGTNQSGQQVDNPWNVAGAVGYYNLSGWWWKGFAVINHYDSSYSYMWASYCTVPVSQADDYFVCASGT